MPTTDAERETPASYPHQSFRIRAAQFKDIGPIASVLLNSFYVQARATQWLYWILRLGIQEDLKTKIKSPVNQYACLVATTLHPDSAQSSAVVGTAEISQRPCETWQLFPPKRAYLSNLAISPTHRRAGAARQLLFTCESIAVSWGFSHIYLHVMADNADAQRLYRRAGYRPCEVSNPILSGCGLRPQRLLLSKAVRSPDPKPGDLISKS
ncbi:MAG: Acetyltransferase [Phormidesmis priestleyi Ana]|uniref:Acetyltransferase n=1 Tax=Phormidesmis priestleyi Ana TaxID=1666911 RepID=A0A0P7ZQJ3_9CYAN|nr:MAG: Acetyltransferase [Phormidesmis priestleyi Ana]